MINTKAVVKNSVPRKVNVWISKRLYDEMLRMQELLMQIHKKKYKRKKHITKLKTSDVLADVCRDARYKIQNGR